MKYTYCNPLNRVACRQRGSAIVLALFILIVLGLLAAVLMRLLADANRSVAVEVYAARAYLAAQSGAELGLTHLFPVTSGSAGGCSDFPFSDNGRWNTLAGLNNCSVTVRCQSMDSPSEYNQTYYTLTSEAVCATSASESALAVARTIEVRARDVSWDE